MKKMKFGALLMSALLILSGCDWSNTTKGTGLGAIAGAGLGALAGRLIGKDGKSTAIGAAIGTAVGAGAGALIGKKMDKAKAAAEAVKNAQVQSITDDNGLEAMKVTYDSGILFASGKSNLSSDAKYSINQLVNNVFKVDNWDIAVVGHTDNTGFRGVTSATENARRNQVLSEERARSVSNYITQQGVSASRIAKVQGMGQDAPVESNETAAGRALNRRVEIYVYASKAMIDAANAGTLK